MKKSDKKEIRAKVEKAINHALQSISLIETKKTQKLVKKFTKEIASVVLDQIKEKIKQSAKAPKTKTQKVTKPAKEVTGNE